METWNTGTAAGTAAMTPSDRQSIEHFVRHGLGCGCPDEVFRSIEIGACVTPDGATQFRRMAIGGRLLVYVYQPRTGQPAAGAIRELALLGRSERETRGFNRFRLVLASTANSEFMASGPQGIFAETLGSDDRAFLHVIGADGLPSSLLPG